MDTMDTMDTMRMRLSDPLTQPALPPPPPPTASTPSAWSSPPSPPLPPSPATLPRRVRTWPALLLLLFLPGITAEILTGSTPVLVYLTHPVTTCFNVLLYGSGALLTREVARRRGLGWPSILLLGAAYGVFEEGLVVNTWANPWLSQICTVRQGVTTGICDYSRVAGINLTWAVSLTIFHAVVSIAIPILLVELLFPRRAPAPWLGRGRTLPVLLVLAEGLVLALGLALNFASYRQHHQAGLPVGPYLVESALIACLIALALTRRPRGHGTVLVSARRAPRLWTLRLVGLLVLGADILLLYGFKGAGAPVGVALVSYALLLALVGWRIGVWSRRVGWSDRHRLALASGALGFLLVVWDPFLALSGSAGGVPTRGTMVVALAYLLVLIGLTRAVGRRTILASASPQPVESVESVESIESIESVESVDGDGRRS